MKSKLFVGTLLAAAVCVAGVAEAQGPSVNTANVKKGGVRYFNATLNGTAIVWLEAVFKEKNIDADIVIFDATDGSGDREAEDTIGIFNSTVSGYEGALFSAVDGATVVICVMHESGPGSRFDLFSYSKTGGDIESGDARRASMSITDSGSFDLYGSVDPAMAGIQETLQSIAKAKR